MKKRKFTEAQIVFAVKQVESGVKIADIYRQIDISEATLLQLGTEGKRVFIHRASASAARGEINVQENTSSIGAHILLKL